MTNPGYTHLTAIVDRSGSMSDVQSEAQSGLNALIREQFALDGKFTLTLVEFDDRFNTVQRMADDEFEYHLVPRGMTALLDAVGQEIVRTGHDLASLAEDQRPGKVVIVVVTDGEENSSAQYPLEKVRALIAEHRGTYDWEFQFLGASEAAWQGAALGMSTTRFANTSQGNLAVYAAASAAMTSFRGSPRTSFAMPDEID